MKQKIINKPKVTEISRTLFKVSGHSVKIQTKKGRKLLICDCKNETLFCNESPFCIHKELVIEHIIKQPIKQHLDKLIKDYEGFLHIKGKLEPYAFVNDLKNLRRSL